MKTPAKTKKKTAEVVVRAGKHTAKLPVSALTPIQYKWSRILVPLDFSPQSQEALKAALSLAEQFGASVTLLHVTEPVIYPTDWVYPILPLDSTESHAAIAKRMEALVSQHAVPAKAVVRDGRAWREIVDLAKAERGDVIVMGSHGFTGLKHALLGSVAEMVVRHAPCTVLAIREPGKKR